MPAFLVISTHAPARGATAKAKKMYGISANFNPRSRKGSDRDHAGSYNIPQHFNPRSRKGSDIIRIIVVFQRLLFQPTLPQGERPIYSHPVRVHCPFQPTLPQGERLFGFKGFYGYRRISTHAPARGATRELILPVPSPLYFNPRSRKGSDLPHWLLGSGRLCISTHAPARGATIRTSNCRRCKGISTHAPARGATKPA